MKVSIAQRKAPEGGFQKRGGGRGRGRGGDRGLLKSCFSIKISNQQKTYRLVSKFYYCFMSFTFSFSGFGGRGGGRGRGGGGGGGDRRRKF